MRIIKNCINIKKQIFLILFISLIFGAYAQSAPPNINKGVRERETDNFSTIKNYLVEKKIIFEEKELLSEYGVWGKSIFINAENLNEKNTFVFAFPILDCPLDTAFALLEKTEALDKTERPALVFLADTFSEASFKHLLETCENPEKTVIFYAKDAALSYGLSFDVYQGEIKNPLHLISALSSVFRSVSSPFAMKEKTIIWENAYELTFSFIADFFILFYNQISNINDSAFSDPDTHYLIFNRGGARYFINNTFSIQALLVLCTGLTIIFIVISFFVPKKNFILLLIPPVVFPLLIVLIFYPPKKKINENISLPDSIIIKQNDSAFLEKINISVEKKIILDRTLYTINAVFLTQAFKVFIFYDIENEASTTEVYEAPFPSETNKDGIAFITGNYPPSPFITEIAFPIDVDGKLRIETQFLTQDGAADADISLADFSPNIIYVWTEE